jgi:hydroxyacylglutathione hydrolase
MVKMELLALPAFADNYIWLLHNGQDALVVDPGDAAPVQAALAQRGLQLRHILITHQHHDHIDGVAELYRAHRPDIWTAIHPQIQGVLPTGAATPGWHELSGSEAFDALGLRWQVLAAPGHTLSHVLFYTPSLVVPAGTAPLLFCGDTLFSAGCGRLFEGSPAQMLQTLASVNALPSDTQICCAHEYTLANLRFAASVYPSNPAVAQRMQQCQQLRAHGLPTLPSSLAQERRFNPFLQSLDLGAHPALPLHLAGFSAGLADALPVFTALRSLRNDFS